MGGKGLTRVLCDLGRHSLAKFFYDQVGLQRYFDMYDIG